MKCLWTFRSDRSIRQLLVSMVMGMCTMAVAQPGQYTTTDRGAIKRYEAGVECMRARQWKCAEEEFIKAAQADGRFVEPRLMLAEIMSEKENIPEAITYYREVMAIAPNFHPAARSHLAELEFRSGQYDAAEANFKAYFGQEIDPQRKAKARLGMESCVFARQAIAHPVPFDPVNLGPGVNTARPEYYPCITADDRTLLFTRRLPSDDPMIGEQEDFFSSQRGADDDWGTAIGVRSVNSSHNEGAGTLSPDGRFIIFTACAFLDGSYGKDRRGMGSCDLFISRRIGDRWTPPENLGPPVNSRNWESQPSLASDGRTLYFVRGTQVRDGVRNTDIFRSSMQADGMWSTPERLGAGVNTPEQEESVQIHPDGRTLYFSSNGHPGMGGLDIFVSRMQADGSWSPAQNMGYPINTSAEENSLLVSAGGELAYFASDRPGGHGDLDLYSFELYPEVRPDAVTFVQGRVFDQGTKAPVEADLLLYDLGTGELATAAYSDPSTGEFLVCIPSGRTYALNASADGFLFFSQTYDVTSEAAALTPFTLQVPMAPIKAGSSIVLRNVFFETASHALLPESHLELGRLASLLEQEPSIRVELGGHTDDIGSDVDNLRLSEYRAQAVRDFLVEQGIQADRLQARGYGETRPVDDNTTEEGRARNRRTEVTIL